jgi:superfamily I DNA/RNA helicase
MIRMLMPDPESNLCVIGDPNQAIYGFRGADVRFIGQFREDYPEAAAYRLNTSYRCSDNILRASGSVIQTGCGEGDFLTGLTRGVKIRIVENNTDKSEAEYVARTIERMIGGTRFFSMDSDMAEGSEEEDIRSLSDFAILCRIGKEMKALEKALTDHGIPYQTVGDDPLFTQEPVRSVIEILKLLVNPHNEFLKTRFMEKKESFKIDLNKWNTSLKGKTVKCAISEILDELRIRKTKDEGSAIARLLDLAEEFGEDYEGFLKLAALGTSADTYRPDLENVRLMTLHASKGLEFKCVFITGCEEGLLPYSLFKSQTADPEEERRLLYVGMTRSMKYLFLTHAKKRFLSGREYRLPRSLFLDKIEKELLEYSKPQYKKPATRDDPQLTLF